MAVTFIRRVTHDAHERRSNEEQRSRRRPCRVSSLLFVSTSDARRALFFRSVRQEKLRPPPSRVGVPLAAGKTPAEIIFHHLPAPRARSANLYLLQTRSFLSLGGGVANNTVDTSHWHSTLYTLVYSKRSRRRARARARADGFRVAPKVATRSCALQKRPFLPARNYRRAGPGSPLEQKSFQAR